MVEKAHTLSLCPGIVISKNSLQLISHSTPVTLQPEDVAREHEQDPGQVRPRVQGTFPPHA